MAAPTGATNIASTKHKFNHRPLRLPLLEGAGPVDAVRPWAAVVEEIDKGQHAQRRLTVALPRSGSRKNVLERVPSLEVPPIHAVGMSVGLVPSLKKLVQTMLEDAMSFSNRLKSNKHNSVKPTSVEQRPHSVG